MTKSSSKLNNKTRFDYNNFETIKLRKELEERRKALQEQGPPNHSLWYSGCGKHLLAILIAIGAVIYVWFANYPEPPLSPILFQWQTMGHNGTKFKHNGHNIFYIGQ